jgi:hypothetical protein
MAISLPIATVVGGDLIVDSLKHEHGVLLESIKIQRENYGGFCEDEDELNETLMPIEQDPEPYANGSIKTRPILKKYALSLCEKLDLELRMDASVEALRDVDLTPQQVKADMKHYVSLCEKKIASQQALCEQLQEQVKQLTDVVKCIVTHPTFDNDYVRDGGASTNNLGELVIMPKRSPMSLLTNSIDKNMPNVQDFLLEQGLPCDGRILLDVRPGDRWNEKIKVISSLHYACYKNNMTSVKKMLNYCSDINVKSVVIPPHMNYTSAEINKICTPISLLEIATKNGSLEMVKFLHEKGAKIGDTKYHVPNGSEGDLVAGYLQTHGSAPVVRF